MLEALKNQVFEANIELPERGLVTYTWGNASGIDRERGLVVIKPSGVDYEALTPQNMAVVDMDGHLIEGPRPSSDTATHLELYKAFADIGGVVHTHSTYATAWAQAGRSIPCYGTTHADYFYGDIPCGRSLTHAETNEGYERNTGLVIVETLQALDPLRMPGIICVNHGSFTWGRTSAEAVHNAVVLEEIAKMAALTEAINPKAQRAPQMLVDKHFFRKHGPGAYYGQKQ